MPERVRTLFDDKGNTLSPTKSHVSPNPISNAQSVTTNRKRKRTDNSIDSQPQPPAQTIPDQPSHFEAKISPKTTVTKLHGSNARTPPNRPTAQPSQKPSPSLRTKAEALLATRKTLPIWPHQGAIRRALRQRPVLLVVGETGSGKSTQVPQFLLAESYTQGDGSGAGNMVAVTQPRRVAAVSLARRVADEMGSTLGAASPASRVGYSVRFDLNMPRGGRNCRVKFLTEGMMLNEMLGDPWLRKYAVVVVDEVHERSVNVDLILGFLRNIITSDLSGRDGRPLKVVVMSATADVEALQRFFEDGFKEKENGQHQDESEASWSGISSNGDDAESSTEKKSPVLSTEVNGNSMSNNVEEGKHTSIIRIEGRQHPVSIHYLPSPTSDYLEKALLTIFDIHYRTPLPGDILVFLTGQDTIESLERLVREYAALLPPEAPRLLVLPLFAALPQAAQTRVFQPAPTPRTRKVILATNIAETSVTVPGVRHVVDSGKAKERRFRAALGLDSLLERAVSAASAVQRAGRAGRDAPGSCWRLYTRAAFEAMAPRAVPEVLRCDVTDALLALKARGVDDVLAFPLLDRPPRQALEKALVLLLRLGALGEDGRVTDVGRRMAGMPLSPSLARCLIESEKMGVVGEVVDVIAALSVENVFVMVATEDEREEVGEKRRELLRREGDHLTLLAAVRAYAAEKTDRKAWSERYGVRHRAMQNVMNVCKQLRATMGVTEQTDEALDSGNNIEAKNETILQCLLKGFAMNTARLVPDGSYKTFVGNQTVAIHPSSVLFGKKVEAIVFSEYVYTNKSYARNVSAVRLRWIEEALVGK